MLPRLRQFSFVFARSRRCRPMFEFVSVQRAATSTFLVLLVLSFVDVISGLSLAIPAAPRGIALETPDQMSAAG